MYRGIIIEESVDSEILSMLKQFTESEYAHMLQHNDKVTILRVSISEPNLLQLMPKFLYAINQDCFYFHFTDGEIMWVVFKGCIMRINKGNCEEISRCRKVGELYSISAELMKFEEMFERDHPND